MSDVIHILGGGSLGLLWAARLSRAGLPCRLLLRTPQALQYWQTNHQQLLLERHGQIEPIQVTAELANTSRQPIHTLIIATKAWAVDEALDSLGTRLQADTLFLLLQNGLGSQQRVSTRFPLQRVLCASVTDGAWKRAANHVVWAGTGQTLIGDLSQKPPPEWLATLDAAGIDWCWEPQMRSVLWLKLAVNCVINPVTALYDCSNGEVPAYLGSNLAPLLTELHALLANQGAQLSLAALTVRINQVIEATASNSSSMRQDVQAGRRTEIDFILGYACRAARQAGIATPQLEQLYQALQQHLSALGITPN